MLLSRRMYIYKNVMKYLKIKGFIKNPMRRELENSRTRELENSSIKENVITIIVVINIFRKTTILEFRP